MPREQWYAGSFESGQMVVDKRRHWRGLLSATYLNSYATFWCAAFSLGEAGREGF